MYPKFYLQALIASLFFAAISFAPAATLQISFEGEVDYINNLSEDFVALETAVSGRLLVDLALVPEADNPGEDSVFYSFEDKPGMILEYSVGDKSFRYDTLLSNRDIYLASVGVVVQNLSYRDRIVYQLREEGREDFTILRFEDTSAPHEMLDNAQFPLSINSLELTKADIHWVAYGPPVPHSGFSATLTSYDFSIIPEPGISLLITYAGLALLLRRRRRRIRGISEI